MRRTAIELQMALSKIHETVRFHSKQKTDLYYYEGKGVLIVLAGYPLIPENVLYKVDEATLRSAKVKITRITKG